MKLFYAPLSPFARKARVLTIELGLEYKVESVDISGVGISPVENHDEINTHNPLGMIPVLVLDDGSSLYDSPVICEYLNHLGDGAFFPQDVTARFKALQLQALGDGIMDLAVALRYEEALRPAELQWPEWISHQYQKIERGFATLEKQCASFSTEPTIGEVAVACALGYYDARFTDKQWRNGHPGLTQWFDGNMMRRKSMSSTVPAV